MKSVDFILLLHQYYVTFIGVTWLSLLSLIILIIVRCSNQLLLLCSCGDDTLFVNMSLNRTYFVQIPVLLKWIQLFINLININGFTINWTRLQLFVLCWLFALPNTIYQLSYVQRCSVKHNMLYPLSWILMLRD